MSQKNYTVIEAADFLRIPVNTLRKHIPEIKRSKLGRRVIFTEESLLNYMERKSSKPLYELKSA